MFVASAALAQESPATDDSDAVVTQESEASSSIITPQDRRDASETIRQQVSERRDAVTQNNEARRATIEDRVKQRIINLAANLSNRLDAATNRMQNITDRLAVRMQTLSENGVDVTEAAFALARAQTAIDAARATLASIDGVVTASVTSENPREAWQTTKATYIAVREDIKTAHQALRDTVAALKIAIQNSTGAGAPTPSTEPVEPDVTE